MYQKVPQYKGKTIHDEIKEGVDKLFSNIDFEEDFHFGYLDEYYYPSIESLEIWVEYLANDITLKNRDEFNSIIEYREYANTAGNKVYKKGQEMERLLNSYLELNGYPIKIKRIESDIEDYYCLFITFSLR